jgi:molybdopterin-guanine dinucleotide biosynthesis protein A
VDRITGLILAGGAGRRMGGADKGLLPYMGRPLVAHVIERLAPQVDRLMISANRNIEDYRAFGYPVLLDGPGYATGDYPGPLAGLAAGLAACPTPWLLACPCDCPALPPDLAARLLAAVTAGGGAALAVATVEGRIQPTFQLCRRESLPSLNAFLAAGNRRVGGWCREMAAIEVPFPDHGAFANINSPEDLAT